MRRMNGITSEESKQRKRIKTSRWKWKIFNEQNKYWMSKKISIKRLEKIRIRIEKILMLNVAALSRSDRTSIICSNYMNMFARWQFQEIFNARSHQMCNQSLRIVIWRMNMKNFIYINEYDVKMFTHYFLFSIHRRFVRMWNTC